MRRIQCSVPRFSPRTLESVVISVFHLWMAEVPYLDVSSSRGRQKRPDSQQLPPIYCVEGSADGRVAFTNLCYQRQCRWQGLLFCLTECQRGQTTNNKRSFLTSLSLSHGEAESGVCTRCMCCMECHVACAHVCALT